MVSDWQNDMQSIRNEHAKEDAVRLDKAAVMAQTESKMMEQIGPLLDSLAEELVAGDGTLQRKALVTQDTGFTIVRLSEEMWQSKGFSVTAKYQDGNLVITVSDGKWEQVKGVLGSWADWTDEKLVYQGDFHEPSIRSAITSSFISWYRCAKNPVQ